MYILIDIMKFKQTVKALIVPVTPKPILVGGLQTQPNLLTLDFLPLTLSAACPNTTKSLYAGLSSSYPLRGLSKHNQISLLWTFFLLPSQWPVQTQPNLFTLDFLPLTLSADCPNTTKSLYSGLSSSYPLSGLSKHNQISLL